MEESKQDFKWLFTEERLLNTPSHRLGISTERELTFRQKEAMLIQSIGSKAHLTQLAVKTSVVFMHRFFMYRSVLYYPRVHLAIAFALAGGKVEESESARKLEHLIRSAVEVLCANKHREFLDKSDQFTYEMDCQLKPKIAALKESRCSTDSAEYLEMRKRILECETEIYSVIGFQLQITHPHNFVLRMCSLLGAEGIKDLIQYAYNLATASSQLTMLCLKYKPETIATMCLNVAFKANSVKLTSLNDPEVKWYQVYDAETDYSEIETVSEEFLKLLKGCPLLPTWMGMVARNGKRSLSGPVRGPGGYPVSRQPASAASAGTKGLSSSNSSSGQNLARERYSNTSSQSSADHGQNRSSRDGDHRTSAMSAGSRPAQSLPVRPKGSWNPPVSSSSSQGLLETESSSMEKQQHPTSSSSFSSMRAPQEGVRHMSRMGSSGDMSVSREEQSRPHSSVDVDAHPNSELDRQRPPQSLSHRQEANHQQQNSIPLSIMSESTSHATLEDEGSPNSQSLNYYSPVAVRPPSPPFPPPVDMDMDENEEADPRRGSFQTNMPYTSSAYTRRISSPDVADSNSSGFSSIPASGCKLSLKDYRQRASAKLKEQATISLPQTQLSSQEELNTSKLEEGFKSEEVKSESTTNSPEEEKPFQAVAGYSFSKPQDSPNNPGLKIKVKRDPTSRERHSVKYAGSGLKIRIKPLKPENEGESTAVALNSEQSTGFNTPREEGEILEDSPSPASSTGSSRKAEGLRIRLSVPKSTDGSGSKRENDQWESRRSAEHESSHRSHHHGHHYHRSHHKSKKHKEHRSSRHEGKPSSAHHSSKRQGAAYPYDERQAKSQRGADRNPGYASGSTGREAGGPPPHPPLAPQYSLQHQNSGFSINDAFSSSLPLENDNAYYGEDANLSAPSTPLDAIPPGHERFHRILEEHRAKEARRPPLPSVPPPPPPPPSSPPPPPPPSF